jgi:integrase
LSAWINPGQNAPHICGIDRRKFKFPGEFFIVAAQRFPHDRLHECRLALIDSGADIKTVQARMRHASARTTLDTYGHLWPDADESTRSAIGAVITERMDSVVSAADWGAYSNASPQVSAPAAYTS